MSDQVTSAHAELVRDVFATLERLNAVLQSRDSATLTLELWCGPRGHGQSIRTIVARSTRRHAAGATSLQARAGEMVSHRHVRLCLGSYVLSEADNWYLPSRLPASMNQMLETTDTPFGNVVQDLQFKRQTLSATYLWEPAALGLNLDEDRIQVAELPRMVLRHHALLTLPDGTPISEVIETYTKDVLILADF